MPYYPERQPDPFREEREQQKRAERKRRIIRLTAVVFSCALIAYGAVRLIQYVTELNASRNTAEDLREIYRAGAAATEPAASPPEPSPVYSVSPEPRVFAAAETAAPVPAETPRPAENSDRLEPVIYPDNPNLVMADRFRKLRRKGKYIVGWIRVDEVDEAVAQRDNDYFLNHDATGKKNSNGAIFMDSSVSLMTRPYTVMLYGHNMKSGNMFGRLKKYRESAYFYKHRIVSFDTMYEDGLYAVFAVMDMNTAAGTAGWYNLWSLSTSNRKDREDAIRLMEKRSAIRSTLDVQADDQLLLLVTCLDGDTERLVVAARRLREGEDPDHLTIR